MKTERNDLIHHLGKSNWLDETAGRAVIVGMDIHERSLVALGSELAKRIRETPYDSENFAKVIALGRHLAEKKIPEGIKKHKNCVFIDELAMFEGKERSRYEWAYEFRFVEGRYQVVMLLPVYFDKSKREESGALECMNFAKKSLNNFVDCRFDKVQTRYESQVIDYLFYFDKSGNKVYCEVGFNHESGGAWGYEATFYFDDLSEAVLVWQKVSEVFTSGRRK